MSNKTPEERIRIPLVVLTAMLVIYAAYMVNHGQ